MVVFIDQPVELVLELVDGVGGGLGGEPFLDGLVEALIIPHVVGWLGRLCFWMMSRAGAVIEEGDDLNTGPVRKAPVGEI